MPPLPAAPLSWPAGGSIARRAKLTRIHFGQSESTKEPEELSGSPLPTDGDASRAKKGADASLGKRLGSTLHSSITTARDGLVTQTTKIAAALPTVPGTFMKRPASTSPDGDIEVEKASRDQCEAEEGAGANIGQQLAAVRSGITTAQDGITAARDGLVAQATKITAALPMVSRTLMEMPAHTLQGISAGGGKSAADTVEDGDGSLAPPEHLRTVRDLLLTRAAAVSAGIGAACAKVPLSLAEMTEATQGYVRDTLVNRRGDFSAEQLYELVPDAIKTKAQATEKFLRSRDLSHIESVKNSPELESDITNVIFENASKNRSRKEAYMKPDEQMRVHLDNFAESIVPGLQSMGTAALQGAVVGALLELPVAAAENFILVQGEGKTWQDASRDVIEKVGKRGFSGAAGAAVFTGIAMLGVPTGAVAAPLAIVGGITYVWSTSDRVWQAIDDVQPEAGQQLGSAVHSGITTARDELVAHATKMTAALPTVPRGFIEMPAQALQAIKAGRGKPDTEAG